MPKDIETIRKEKIYSASPLQTGLLMGALMSIFLLLVEINSTYMETGIGFKFMKFIILASVLGYSLSALKKSMDDRRHFFKRGFIYGIKSIFVAGVLLVVINLMTIPLEDFSLATFTASLAEVTEVPHHHHDAGFVPFITSSMLFLETLVLGFLVNIGLLVFIKDYGRTP